MLTYRKRTILVKECRNVGTTEYVTDRTTSASHPNQVIESSSVSELYIERDYKIIYYSSKFCVKKDDRIKIQNFELLPKILLFLKVSESLIVGTGSETTINKDMISYPSLTLSHIER